MKYLPKRKLGETYGVTTTMKELKASSKACAAELAMEKRVTLARKANKTPQKPNKNSTNPLERYYAELMMEPHVKELLKEIVPEWYK